MTSEAAEDTPNSRNAANANDVSPVIIMMIKNYTFFFYLHMFELLYDCMNLIIGSANNCVLMYADAAPKCFKYVDYCTYIFICTYSWIYYILWDTCGICSM